jgi:prolyl-tRNA editing enzyme YbaK/EbsC (Cys-tRNA(Pro) deacylase)
LNELPPAAQRVQTAAAALGLRIEVRLMPASTRTAADAAAACGCQVGQIIKSLIFRGKESSAAYLILVSGANRVDEDKAEGVIGEAIVRPDADFVREATGFAIGGIPPIGHTRQIRTFFDEDLLQYETVWAAAGTPNAVFAVDPKALSDVTAAKTLAVR